MTTGSALLACLLVAAAPQDAADLSGYWSPAGGALVEVRQTGSEIWAADDGARWAFHGRVEGDLVAGSWIDLQAVPFATGAMTLKIRSPERLSDSQAADKEWVKQLIPKGAVVLKWTSTFATTLADLACATVWCPPGGVPGAVWGSEVYTGDSSICGAAAHSGLLSLAQGGSATVRALTGQQAYQGSERNGVSSQSWASYGTSFTFGKQCDPNEPLPGERMDKPISATGGTNATAVSNRKGAVWFSCPPSPVLSTVWGVDTYSSDSSVCGAAIHAGAIQAKAGGLVGIERVGPQPALQGSARNGVVSTPFGPWSKNFKVVRPMAAEKP
ncbi:MAG TPA: LCCL domain-containing protein [Myxococcales bacterium]|jgi:hypothetical protein